MDCGVLPDCSSVMLLGKCTGVSRSWAQSAELSIPPQLPRVDSPFPKGTTRTKVQLEEPAVAQIDPKWCARSILLWQPGNCSVLIFRPTSLYSTLNPQGVRPRLCEELRRRLGYVFPYPIRTIKPEWHAGRPVLRSQLSVHDRCSIKARVGSERDGCCLHANRDPNREQFALP